ncbi:MAG: hypothetical protein ACE37F_13780 [Nannocystaceae bacterium]|nr:hypothetical protein [bacterium]
MRSTTLGLLVVLTGCGSSSPPAVVPTSVPADADTVPLQGTVDTIHFQNINKAQGHYTYNVELVVVHQGMPESPHEEDRAPGSYRVRVHRVYWSELGADEQLRLAPDGPKNEMHVEAWRGYAVGDAVDLQVVGWGSGHGAAKLSSPAR